MFGLCCFAHSGAAKEPPKTKPPNLLEEPAENLEAFKEGLRSISTPATSFQKLGPEQLDKGPLPMPPQLCHSLTSPRTKCKKSKGAFIPPRDMEVFERRQFEAYKEEVEKRRRLQLIERQMALFNTWEFYNEQEMWDLLVRYNQYIQSGHQIFLTPMPDCPIHGHSITSKHQQSKRGHKPHKKLKQRRRPSTNSLSDDQSSPYASHYSDNPASDRSRSSLTSQVSVEIHSTEKNSMESVLKIMTAVDSPPLSSDASEKDSGIDKNSINSSIGNGSDRSSRKSLDSNGNQKRPESPTASHDEVDVGLKLDLGQTENEYDLDVPPKPEEEDDVEKNELAEYRDYREGIYYAREEVKPDPVFGAIWDNSGSPTINTYEDMDIDRRESPRSSSRRPRQRDASDVFAPTSEPRTEVVYGNQFVDEGPSPGEERGDMSSLEKYFAEEKSCTDVSTEDSPGLIVCEGDQCSPSKVMLRSLNLSSHNLSELPKSNESSLERKNAYSKVNKDSMKVYDLSADVRHSLTPPPPPVKRIDALIHEEQDFYDDSRGQPESESLIRLVDHPSPTGSPAIQRSNSIQSDLADVHQPRPPRSTTPIPADVLRRPSTPETAEAKPPQTEPVIIVQQPRRSVENCVTSELAPSSEGCAPTAQEAEDDGQTYDSAKVMFDMPKLRDASERKITPINEESDELSIRTEIQKVITKLHKTGGWREATCTPGESYLTLDLRKEAKTEVDLAIVDGKEPLAPPEPPPDATLKLSEPARIEVKEEPAAIMAEVVDKTLLPCSQIDMEALDFKKAREALKKFTNDGSNPLLKQVPNRSIPVLIDEARHPGESLTNPLKARLTKTVSAPPNLKAAQPQPIPPPPCAPPAAAQAPSKPQASPEALACAPAEIVVRDEEEDRINFKAARETLQKLTSLNNGMFFMTDRKNRQAF